MALARNTGTGTKKSFWKAGASHGSGVPTWLLESRARGPHRSPHPRGAGYRARASDSHRPPRGRDGGPRHPDQTRARALEIEQTNAQIIDLQHYREAIDRERDYAIEAGAER